MKKVAAAFTFTLLAVVGLSAQAQTKDTILIQPKLQFRLDTAKLDSFYVIETYTAAVTRNAPAPATNITPLFFRDTAQARYYIANLKSDADKAAKQAQEYLKQAQQYDQAAKLWALKSDAIERLVNGSDWFMGRTKKVTTKPTGTTKPPETKPTKKKKKH